MRTFSRSLGIGFQIAPGIFVRIHEYAEDGGYNVDISGVLPTQMQIGDWIVPCVGIKIHLLSKERFGLKIGIEKKKLKAQTA